MTKSDKYKFFKDIISSYIMLPDKSLKDFYDIFELRTFEKNEKIISFGQIESHFNILMKGTVVSYAVNSKGKIYHKNIFFKKQFLGSTVSALNHQKSYFELMALTESTLLSCRFKDFKALIKKNYDINNFYIAYLEKNWVIDKEKRELDIIFKDAKERYLEFIAEFPEAETNVPMKIIASHLGITPTQLSRIRSSKL